MSSLCHRLPLGLDSIGCLPGDPAKGASIVDAVT